MMICIVFLSFLVSFVYSQSYESFDSSKAYCEYCLSNSTFDGKGWLCETDCESRTTREQIGFNRLDCHLAKCNGNEIIISQPGSGFNCGVLSDDKLLKTPCEATTMAVVNTKAPATPKPDDSSAVGIILGIVGGVCVLAIVLLAVGIMMRGSSKPTVNNVSVVVENKTEPKKSKKKTPKVAMGIPDTQYPPEAGGSGTKSISTDYPSEAGGSLVGATGYADYDTDVSGYGKTAGYPPQAGAYESGSDSEAPPD